jgi:hypothetical protein
MDCQQYNVSQTLKKDIWYIIREKERGREDRRKPMLDVTDIY